MSQMRAIVDKLLTNVSNGIFSKDYFYACESLFPVIDVVQSSGKLGKYGASHLRIVHTLMGGRSAARRVEPITRETDSYLLEKHGLEGMVTEEDYANVEEPFDAEKDETEGVTTMLLTAKEKVVADTLTNTSIMTSNVTLSGTDQFSDHSNSDPLGVADDAKEAMYDGAGVEPNVCIMSKKVRNKLKYHPQILENLGFKYADAGKMNDEQLAQALDVKKIICPDAVYNAAEDGQTDDLQPIWGKHMIFALLPETAKHYQKSLGYYIRKKGVGSRKVYKYPFNNPANSTGILVEDFYDYVLSDVLCAYLVKNAVA